MGKETDAVRQQLHGRKDKSRYANILQGKATNTLSTISNKPIQQSLFSGKGYDEDVDEVTIDKNSFSIIITKASKIRLDVRAQQFIDLGIRKFSESIRFGSSLEEMKEKRNITITLKEWQEFTGIKNRTAARQSLAEALRAAYNIEMKWTEVIYRTDPKTGKRKKLNKIHWQARLLVKKGLTEDIQAYDVDTGQVVIIPKDEGLLERGKAVFTISEDLAEYLVSAYVMPYPEALGLCSPKTSAYYYGKKMADNYNQNFGRKNQNIIGVATLLSCSQELPKYDKIKSDGQIYQRIIAPFERDIKSLVELGILDEWKYCTENGAPLPDGRKNPQNYEEFIKLNIYYVMAEYPEREQHRKAGTDVEETMTAESLAGLDSTLQ